MKKGFAEFFLIGSMIIVCLAINAISKPYSEEDRADIQKSFGAKQGNVITAWVNYSDMTEAQKKEFDKTSPNSPSFW